MALNSAPKLSVVSVALLFVSAFAALSVAIHRPAGAQSVVTPSCPQGYKLSGSQCIEAAPTPTCPTGYTFSGGQCVAGNTTTTSTPSTGPWVIVTDRALGVGTAADMSGATICVVTGSPSETALAAYFRTNGMSYEPVAVSSERSAIDGYLDQRCDAFLVSDATADATVNNIDISNNHIILPELIGRSSTTTTTTVTPTVTAPTQPADLTYPLQTQLKRIGCLTGQVDGIWGNGSRAALRRFAQLSGLNLGTEPTQRALDEANSRQAGYCPKIKKQPTTQPVYRCNNKDYAFCNPIAEEYCEGESGNSCFNQELVTCLRNEIGCKP